MARKGYYVVTIPNGTKELIEQLLNLKDPYLNTRSKVVQQAIEQLWRSEK